MKYNRLQAIVIIVTLFVVITGANAQDIDPCDMRINNIKYGTKEYTEAQIELFKQLVKRGGCSFQVQTIKKDLQKRVDEINSVITTSQRFLLDPSLETAIKTELKTKIEALQNELIDISEVISIPKQKEDLIIGYADYDPFFFKFNLGYEYLTINEMFQDGFPRIGFMVYQRSKGDAIRKIHVFGGARLSNSAEQKIEGDPKEDMGGKSSLEFDLNAYFPFIKTDLREYTAYLGPVVSIGGRKTDEVDHVDGFYYIGFRSSINPEMYFDILYGKTESLDSQRLEVRAQLPVMRFANGSRLFLGTITNIGIDSKKRNNESGQAEEDVIRIYLSWNVDFSEIWGGKSE